MGVHTIFVHDGRLCLFLPGSSHDDSRTGIVDSSSVNLFSTGNCNCNCNNKLVSITASTNGLVCLHITGGELGINFLHVFNPSTQEGQPIPCSVTVDSVGLAFDPAISPLHYKLVHPVIRNSTHKVGTEYVLNVEYGFEVFSSRCAHQMWVRSNQRVALPQPRKNRKPVFARGVLYWHCTEYLLWFDCDNEAAGYILLPPQGRYVDPMIGVRDGRVTCTQVTREGLEVWELVHGRDGAWEMKHRFSLGKMVQEKLPISMSLRTRKRKRYSGGNSKDDDDDSKGDRVLKKLWMRPLPFEGGEKVYLKVKLRPQTEAEDKYYYEWGKLVSFDLKTGDMREERFNGELLFGYSKIVFGYEKNSVPFPELCFEEE